MQKHITYEGHIINKHTLTANSMPEKTSIFKDFSISQTAENGIRLSRKKFFKFTEMQMSHCNKELTSGKSEIGTFVAELHKHLMLALSVEADQATDMRIQIQKSSTGLVSSLQV
jgi:hypothetical protein